MSASDPRHEDDATAAEMVLGLLDDEEVRAAEQRLAADAGFRAAHRWWSDLLPRVFGDAEEAPPPSLWGRITAQLPANEDAASARPVARGWRSAALAALAACLLLAVGLGVTLARPAERIVQVAPPPVPAEQLVAVLTNPHGKPATLAIRYDPGTGRLTLVPREVEQGAGSLELWVIAPGQQPRAVGLLPATRGELTSAPGALALIRSDVTLAVSAEPRGGSPGAGPSGPIVLKGPLVTL